MNLERRVAALEALAVQRDAEPPITRIVVECPGCGGNAEAVDVPQDDRGWRHDRRRADCRCQAPSSKKGSTAP